MGSTLRTTLAHLLYVLHYILSYASRIITVYHPKENTNITLCYIEPQVREAVKQIQD